jgi:hypothetical protein
MANDFISPDATVVYCLKGNIVYDGTDPRTPAQIKALADARLGGGGVSVPGSFGSDMSPNLAKGPRWSDGGMPYPTQPNVPLPRKAT